MGYRSYGRRFRLSGLVTLACLLIVFFRGLARWWQAYANDGVEPKPEDGVYNNTIYVDGNESTVYQSYNFSDPCRVFPKTEGIMLVMKTGATEAFDRLPTQLLTTMRCLPDFLLFSDMVSSILSLSFPRQNRSIL